MQFIYDFEHTFSTLAEECGKKVILVMKCADNKQNQ